MNDVTWVQNLFISLRKEKKNKLSDHFPSKSLADNRNISAPFCFKV